MPLVRRIRAVLPSHNVLLTLLRPPSPHSHCNGRRCGYCAGVLLLLTEPGVTPICGACGEQHEVNLARHHLPGRMGAVRAELTQSSAMLGIF